jgi:glycosyltransferase involved in cell wall biosynthesis
MSVSSPKEQASGGQQLATYPKVSVLVPCYNGAKTVREAIDSALTQTYPNVEIVVVNDGSKDDSLEVLRTYGDKIVLVDQANRGLSGARNTAIEHSSGDFLILLDSDDIFLPDTIEKRVRPMLENPKVALVAGYYREIDAEGNLSPRIPEVRKLDTTRPTYDQALKRNYGPPVGWCIRKQALYKAGVFDPMLPHCEDYDLCLRILTKWEMAYVPDVTAHYRQHPGGQSKRFLEYYKGVCQVLKKNSVTTHLSPTRYWWLAQHAKFEASRRILYAVLTTGSPGERISKLATYCFKRPEFLIFGVLSFFSLLGGKRATGR